MISRFYLLCGVPGVGKTTIGTYLAAHHQQITYISAGEMKRQLMAGAKYCHKSLWQLNQSESLDINAKFFATIFRNQVMKGKHVLIDTHFTYTDPLRAERFIRLTPASAKIDGLVLLQNNPADIMSRRIERGRGRDAVSLPQIWRELYAESTEAKEVAKSWNLPLFQLYSNGPLDALARKLLTHLGINDGRSD